MNFLCVFAVLLVAVSAQNLPSSWGLGDNNTPPPPPNNPNPDWFIDNREYRFRRDLNDLSVDRKVGDDGRIFGSIGSNANGLFGKGGYEHNFFNDHRGNLNGQVTGTRVLGPYGDSSHMGGALNWKNSNAAASIEASKQIHGPTSYNAAAGGRWPLGKNGDVTAQGFYEHTSGLGRDYGAKANLNYRF